MKTITNNSAGPSAIRHGSDAAYARIASWAKTAFGLKDMRIIKRISDPYPRMVIQAKYEGRDAIIRVVSARKGKPSMAYLQSDMVNVLARRRAGEVSVPGILHRSLTGDYEAIISERMHGKSLMTAGTNMLQDASTVISWLERTSGTLKDNEKRQIPKRHPLVMTLTFPVLLMLAMQRHSRMAAELLRVAYVYFRSFTLADLLRPQFSLAHRDLSPENIIRGERGLSVIDWEVAALTERDTDISLLPRFYYRYVPVADIVRHLPHTLTTGARRKRFFRLTIFYAIHYLALMDLSDPFVPEAKGYVSVFLKFLYPALKPGKLSVYEKLLKTALSLPYLLRFPESSFKPRNDAMLCYHSVSDDGGRFSTPTAEFSAHMEYLSRHYSVVPVTDMISGRKKGTKPRISITFDDGYQSVYSEAFPVLAKHRMKASVFVIGSAISTTKRKSYLENTTMNQEELALLTKNGWTVGYHTETHNDLRLLETQKITREVGIREPIRAILTRPYVFAYPYGGYSKAAHDIVLKSGYAAAFTVDGGTAGIGKNRRFNRIPVEGRLTQEEFMVLCSPYGMAVSKIFMMMIHTKVFVERSVLAMLHTAERTLIRI